MCPSPVLMLTLHPSPSPCEIFVGVYFCWRFFFFFFQQSSALHLLKGFKPKFHLTVFVFRVSLGLGHPFLFLFVWRTKSSLFLCSLFWIQLLLFLNRVVMVKQALKYRQPCLWIYYWSRFRNWWEFLKGRVWSFVQRNYEGETVQHVKPNCTAFGRASLSMVEHPFSSLCVGQLFF